MKEKYWLEFKAKLNEKGWDDTDVEKIAHAAFELGFKIGELEEKIKSI